MARALRLLLVEDVEDHALLILRELERAGFSPDCRRIETSAELAAALREGEWDAVISDFSLPGFTALDVLLAVRATGKDLPVIIVSGVIGEETAVEAMRAGAKDFILKGKYSRLGPALERELAETAVRRERKQAVQELVRAHEELKEQRAELESQHRELLETYHRLTEETAQRVQMVEELRRKEQMMMQQSRMAAIGEVLNNLAHHWRQPLNVLALNLQHLELLKDTGELKEEAFDSHIRNSLDVVRKLSGIISDFHDFSTGDRDRSLFSVDEAVKRTVALVRESYGEQNIGIEVEAGAGELVDGYANDFRQALLNILMNAKEALAGAVAEEPRIAVRSWREGGRTVVTVTDNAGGIKAENLEAIFQPFYTTKEVGRGTGVGLFLARKMIENMGGRLSARNVEGGAEFRIDL